MEIDIKTVVENYTQMTILALMLSIGLKEGFQGLSILWQKRSLLIRCLLASLVLVPLAGMVVLRIVPMDTSARIGLMAMAICPGAPLLYKKVTTMKANTSLAGSFQITTSLFAILAVPVWVIILRNIYPAEATISPTEIFAQVTIVQFIPIIIGLVICEWIPTLADDLLEPVQKISSLMFLGLVIVLLVVALPKVLQVGVVTTIGVVLFIAASIIIGHYLGGPEPETRLTIALANSTRNAGLSLAIVSVNFDDPGILAVIAVIALLAFVAGAIYANLYRKQST
jgi:BASS family bile acid:Na+ symporter